MMGLDRLWSIPQILNDARKCFRLSEFQMRIHSWPSNVHVEPLGGTFLALWSEVLVLPLVDPPSAGETLGFLSFLGSQFDEFREIGVEGFVGVVRFKE
jgi:hypothetical protein